MIAQRAAPRQGARTTRELLQRARGRYCAAAQRGLRAAARARRGAARRARGSDPRGGAPARGSCARTARRRRRRGAFRAATALVGAVFLHRRSRSQSNGERDPRGRLGAVGGAARAPRGRRARSAGSTRRTSSTPTRSTSAGACATPAGAPVRPGGAASTTSSSRPAPCPSAASSSSSRNRDRYMRKHHSAPAAWASAGSRRGPTRCARVGGARPARAHPRALLASRARDAAPERGEGLREAAAAYNAQAPAEAAAHRSRRGSSA